ncbi:MAG: NDP-sugar synthase [Proteobacteria bacterium]|nr:NDP-sugar synthase [Pseudomonadota bacterium]
MRGMLLAAGYGTRLAPLTDALPKPVIPVANRPMGWFALDHLARSGVTDLVANTHHLPEVVQEQLSAVCPEGASLRFVHEPVLLGTGGGISNALRPQAGETLVVANSDVLFAPDLQAALSLHRRTGAIATMIVRRANLGQDYGSVEVDHHGRVRRLLGRPEAATKPLRRVVFAGYHILDARAWGALPAQGCIVRTAYREWLDRGEIVMSAMDLGPWRDAGDLAGYLQANSDLASGRLRFRGVDPPHEGAICHPNANVDPEAVLHQVVVGAHANVGPVRLRRVVVWPHTTVNEAAQDSILTPSGKTAAGAP